MAKGFFVLAGAIMPSHVHADIAAFDCPVIVAGMAVSPGDLIHADRHGSVVIPEKAAADLPAAARLLAQREKILLDACKWDGFSTASGLPGIPQRVSTDEGSPNCEQHSLP